MPLVTSQANNGLILKTNAMTLSDFILLSLEQKGYVALHEGVLVAKRTTTEHLIFLFQINTFYLEMFCSLKSRSIEEMRMFDETKLLNPYLETIEINDLFK